MLLEANDLNVYYGAIHALQGVSFSVDEGEIVTLIGANGAGKSTTLKTISGLLRPRVGDVLLRGESLKTMPAQDIVRRGVIHVPEGRKIFAPLTVQENLEMGAFSRKDKAEIRQNLERVFKSFPRLKERLNQLGGTLSGGEQQMLAIGRALMVNPSLLLLDEPMEGLAPIIVQELMSVIRELVTESGMAMIIVEQHAKLALALTRKAIVLERGRVVHRGASEALLADPATLHQLVAVS